jgi:hypothetical protein
LAKTVFAVITLSCLCVNAAYSQNNNRTNVGIVYGKHKDFDRFVFEYDKKPEYSINSDSYLTTLKFSDSVNVFEKDNSFENYPRKDLLNKETSSSGISYIIPAPKIKSFEYQNKIVVDVVSYKNIKNEETPSKKAKTMEAPKSLEPKLTFEWNKEVGLAVFYRGENIWIVFDDYRQLDIKSFPNPNNYIESAMQLPSSNITVLILKLKPLLHNIDIQKDGLNWTIDFSGRSPKQKETLSEKIMTDNNGSYYLSIPTKSVKNVIMTLDPITGDILMITPAVKENLGYDKKYKYVDLSTIQTFQGFAIEAYTDDILISKESDGITIRGIDRSLNISPNLEDLKKQALTNK